MIQINRPMPSSCKDCFCNNDEWRCEALKREHAWDYDERRDEDCPLEELTECEDAVSREEVLKLFPPNHSICLFDLKQLYEAIQTLSSVMPERKPGKWLPDNNNYYVERFICSKCGGNYKVDTCMGRPDWNFCPNCGADMRGEQDDT